MRLRTFIKLDVAVLVVAALVFAVLLPENFDSGGEVSPVYAAAFWTTIVALAALVALLVVAAAARLLGGRGRRS